MLIRSSKYFRAAAAVLTVILFFLFGGMEFLHNHSGSHSDDKCPVCSLSCSLSSSLIQSKNIFLTANTFEILNFECCLNFIELKVHNLNNSRAPPLSV